MSLLIRENFLISLDSMNRQSVLLSIRLFTLRIDTYVEESFPELMNSRDLARRYLVWDAGDAKSAWSRSEMLLVDDGGAVQILDSVFPIFF